MREYMLLYIDDEVDPQLSEYLDKGLKSSFRDEITLQIVEYKFIPTEGYKSLLSNPLVSSANIILIDSRLFEDRSANEGKFSGEEFKIILKKLYPFIEVVVITQNGADDSVQTIAKYDPSCGKTTEEYYNGILPGIIQQAIDQVTIYRNLADKFKSNESWEPIMKERIIGSLEGTSVYDSLTTEDIDKLVIAFKELSEKIND